MPRPAPKPLLVLLALLALPIPVLAATLYPHTSRHYEILTDVDRADIRDIAAHMDAVADEYDRRFSSFPARDTKPSKLCIFRSRDDYIDFMATLDFPAGNTGGVFFSRPDGAGLATWLEGRSNESMLAVLQHEGFHQFLHERLGDDIPPWANEGMAEYYGQALMVRGRFRTGIVPGARLEQLQTAIRQNALIPFDVVVRLTQDQWGETLRTNPETAAILYSEAWSMAHYLLHADNGAAAPAFEAYVRAVAGGTPNEQALADAFGTTDMRRFQQSWGDYVLTLEPDPVSVAVERLQFLAEGVSYLHENGIPVATMGDLQRQLRARRFRLRVFEHDTVRTFSADDAALFEPPPSNTRQPARITLTPSRFSAHPSRRDLPPMIDVTGLGPYIRLHWRRDDTGALLSQISIE